MIYGGRLTKTQYKKSGIGAPMYREPDEKLEAAIDKAGRERVFARAHQLGWNPEDLVPKFVWWGIATDLGQIS